VHPALQRRPGAFQAVEQVAQHGAVDPLFVEQVAAALERGVEHAGGVACALQGARGRLGVEQVDRDGVHPVHEGTRQGPHLPVGPPLQFAHHRVADDAAGADDQRAVLRTHALLPV
jgi:hypothetical protein